MKLTNAIKSAVPVAVLGFLALGLASTSAFALTQTAAIAVSATVVDSCSISANALGFGTYTGAALPASTTITVTCTNLGAYTVGLNGGGTGTDVARIMTGPGANVLNYNLYTTAGLATIWGNTAAHNWVAGTGTGSAQTLTVFGNVAAAQPLAVGNYSDSVTATVTY
jgi:spore coat protein U-like protein